MTLKDDSSDTARRHKRISRQRPLGDAQVLWYSFPFRRDFLYNQ